MVTLEQFGCTLIARKVTLKYMLNCVHSETEITVVEFLNTPSFAVSVSNREGTNISIAQESIRI